MNHNRFIWLIAVFGAIGESLDVIGTYVAQPDLHAEGNPLAALLVYLTPALRWPVICAAKLAWLILGVMCLRRCITHAGLSLTANSSSLVAIIRAYGRTGPERTIYRNVVMTLGFCALLWLSAAYAGIENFAYHYSWWRPLGFTVHRLWIPVGVIVAAFIGLTISACLFHGLSEQRSVPKAMSTKK